MPPALTLEFPSSSTRPERRSTRSDACARPWSSREGASLPPTTRATAARNASLFAALPQLQPTARPPGEVGTDPTTRHRSGRRGPSHSAPTSPAINRIRPAGLARQPAVPEQVNDTVVVPGPERKTNWERFRDDTTSFANGTRVVLERLGQLVALVKPTAHPLLCQAVLVCLGFGLALHACALRA